jgi:hypothetical protein
MTVPVKLRDKFKFISGFPFYGCKKSLRIVELVGKAGGVKRIGSVGFVVDT